MVVSDDGAVDGIPILRPRARRSTVEEHVAKLEASAGDNYHPVISWLDEHRFYPDEAQCARVNAAMTRLNREPRDVGEMRILREEFRPDPRCTADDFEPDPGS